MGWQEFTTAMNQVPFTASEPHQKGGSLSQPEQAAPCALTLTLLPAPISANFILPHPKASSSSCIHSTTLFLFPLNILIWNMQETAHPCPDTQNSCRNTPRIPSPELERMFLLHSWFTSSQLLSTSAQCMHEHRYAHTG